jgi:hypothetical protein
MKKTEKRTIEKSAAILRICETNEWGALVDERKHYPDILCMRIGGYTHEEIAKTIGLPISRLRKIAKRLADDYDITVRHRKEELAKKIASGNSGFISYKSILVSYKSEFDYITHPRTIEHEMHVLAPRIKELKVLTDLLDKELK